MLLKEKVEEFPTGPGVYLMKEGGGGVIYVGKANNLRKRVRSYFRHEARSRYQISFLMNRVKIIDTIVCQNEKEALLLENSLIKKYRPRYNIFLKDDKSYVSLKLSFNHPYPCLTVTRKIKRDGAQYFGPYSSAVACRETVDFIYRHFLLRTCSDHDFAHRSRPCIEYEIHRCTAPCVGYVSQEDYSRQVHQVRLFLEGKNGELISQLEKQMEEASVQEQFERAAVLRDLMGAIRQTLEKQRVVKHGGGNQDAIYLRSKGGKCLFTILMIREGRVVDSRYHVVESMEGEEKLMGFFLSQYYLGAAFVPDEILLSVRPSDFPVLEEVLTEQKGSQVDILCPQKGEKRGLIEWTKKNSDYQWMTKVAGVHQAGEILAMVQGSLDLPRIPRLIECYDVSNISGRLATASSIVFKDGHPDRAAYRHYKIRLSEGPNDYAMMMEVLQRRFRSQKTDVDLIVIDGGKGQLHCALKVLEELGIKVPVIGLAKGKGRGVRAKGSWEGKKEEEIFLPGRKNPLRLKKGSAELLFLQKVRDEAHRFALRYHQKLRDWSMSETFLDGVKGVGRKTRETLYKRFKNKGGMANATIEDLCSTRGVTREMATEIKRLASLFKSP